MELYDQPKSQAFAAIVRGRRLSIGYGKGIEPNNKALVLYVANSKILMDKRPNSTIFR